MKLSICLALALPAVSITAGPAPAKTAAATIAESAHVVPGNSVSAYIVGGELITDVRNDALQSPQAAYDEPPFVRVSFEMQPSWRLVKRVSWNKSQRRLTIDF